MTRTTIVELFGDCANTGAAQSISVSIALRVFIGCSTQAPDAFLAQIDRPPYPPQMVFQVKLE